MLFRRREAMTAPRGVATRTLRRCGIDADRRSAHLISRGSSLNASERQRRQRRAARTTVSRVLGIDFNLDQVEEHFSDFARPLRNLHMALTFIKSRYRHRP
jgi:hypothetical protein